MDKNILNDIIVKLKKLGCDESDVFFSETTTLSSSSRLGKIEIGLRAIIIKNTNISTTNLFREY